MTHRPESEDIAEWSIIAIQTLHDEFTVPRYLQLVPWSESNCAETLM